MNQKLDQSVFENAPEWARWAAINQYGAAFFYENRPRKRPNVPGWKTSRGKMQLISYGLFPSCWQSSLIERKGGE